MNSDPLQRRMFAQQMINQHAKANQPMGILASSPQLMGAVQGFKDGGVVKGYKVGGFENIYNPNPSENLTFADRIMRGEGILQAQKNVEKDKKIKSTGIDETGVTTTPLEALTKQAEKEKIEGKSLDKIEKDNKKSNVNIDSFAKDKKGSVNLSQPIVDKKAKIIEPGAKINETNAKLTQTDKELKEAIPAGKNLGAKKVTSKIDEKIEEAANSYEKHKEKLGKTDDRYAADEAKRTDYMKKIENIMEEEEDEIDLNSVDKKARDVLGLKEGEYDDDKVTAFWMSMIKGGLATAAGESGNALTNIAKGLAFGVESYGKDINNISMQEREDRQNLAKMKYNLMKDEKSAKTAERTLRIQAYGELAKLEENKFQFKTENEYKVARNKVLDEMAMAKLDLTSMQVLNSMKMGDLNYEAKIREITLNEKKQDDYVKLTEKQLSMQMREKSSTKEIKNIFALGSDYATYEDGEFKFTTKGRAMLIASTASKTKFTDLVTTAKAVGANKKIAGYSFETAERAEEAYYYYEGITKPAIAALSKTEKTIRGLDSEAIETKTKELLAQFAKDTGGVLEGGSGGGANVAPKEYDTQPDNATLKVLQDQGYTQVIVGGKKFNITPK
tara:strand:+ start:514 stop:2358 length:1845 start_codon:yes stop_codon:yes gene_type:complete